MIHIPHFATILAISYLNSDFTKHASFPCAFHSIFGFMFRRPFLYQEIKYPMLHPIPAWSSSFSSSLAFMSALKKPSSFPVCRGFIFLLKTVKSSFFTDVLLPFIKLILSALCGMIIVERGAVLDRCRLHLQEPMRGPVFFSQQIRRDYWHCFD